MPKVGSLLVLVVRIIQIWKLVLGFERLRLRVWVKDLSLGLRVQGVGLFEGDFWGLVWHVCPNSKNLEKCVVHHWILEGLVGIYRVADGSAIANIEASSIGAG